MAYLNWVIRADLNKGFIFKGMDRVYGDHKENSVQGYEQLDILPLCVRDRRRKQLTESNGIENGMERATWQEL